MFNRTIVMYDFDRIKGTNAEFTNFDDPKIRRQLDIRVFDMQDTIKSLQAVFGGEILLLETYVRDKCGNRILITEQPIALEVPFYLSHREIDYIKEIDDGLIAVM